VITESQIQEAAQAILDGNIVVYPTETAYGIGVNALDPAAVQKLYDLKGRGYNKPTHICIQNIDEADQYAIVDDRARKLAYVFTPGPLSLVMPTRGALPDLLEKAGGDERGIRIPAHPVAQKLLELTNVPITACSANLANGKTPYSIPAVKQSFGSKSSDITFFLDAGVLPKVLPSTLLSLMSDKPIILRQGPITMGQIQSVLDS
jgi:L-threonylcarbamoyladenylate synthase